MIRLLLASARHRWVEHVLGVAMIALVTGALVAQRSVSQSAEGTIHDLAHMLGKNMLVVPSGTDMAGFHSGKYGDAVMPEHFPRALRSSPLGAHIKSAQARLYGNVTSAGTDLAVVGEDAGEHGALLSGHHVMLTREASRRLGLAPGASFVLGDVPVTVRDVVDPPADVPDVAVISHLPTAQRILGRPGSINAMRLGGCWCRLDVPTLGTEVERQLPGTRTITVAGMLKAQTGTVAVMKKYSNALLVTGFALVCAIIAAMTASQVRRAVRETGLMLAVGARPRSVTISHLVQAAVVGAVGGIIGVTAAIPATARLGALVLDAPVAPPPGMFPYVVGACAIAAIVSAAVPAVRAGRTDPVEALRED